MIAIPELEAWLDAHDITWVLKADIPVEDIDHMAGLANQARLTTLDEDVVDRYAADMAAGATFPPVVLNDVADGLVPLGGNHRIAAARRAGRTHLDAYVLTDVDDTAGHLLAIEDNRRHGLPLSDDERLYHAVHLVQQGDHSLNEAAEVCGITMAKVQRQMQVNTATRRAIRLDIDGWGVLSASTKHRLASIEDDGVFARAVQVFADGTLPATSVPDVVSRINRADTPADARAILTDLTKATRGATFRTAGRPPSAALAPRSRLLSDLAGIIRYQPEVVDNDCRTVEQRAQLSQQIRAAARVLMAIDKELNR